MKIPIQFRLMFHRVTPGRVLSIAFATYALGVILLLSTSSAVAVRDSNSVSPDHGRDVFERRCTGCHSLDNEKEGPRLRGVYGRKSGSVTSFTYSDALKKANITWDESNLDKWLADPDKFIPDVDMDFHLEKPDERSAVIAYLKQLSGK
jgi:cytochrome c